MLQIFSSGMSPTDILIVAAAFLIAIGIALSIHEYAHAYVAVKQGDKTPRALGRLTLNPLAHLDPLGFAFLLFFGFGWAKPVYINPNNFKNYRRGFFLTSIAGVVANLILAFISAGFLVLIVKFFNNNNSASMFLHTLFSFLTSINITLAIFNLLPIYPLDGFNILKSVLRFNNPFILFMHKYGTFILLGLLISGLLSTMMMVAISLIESPILVFWFWLFGIGV